MRYFLYLLEWLKWFFLDLTILQADEEWKQLELLYSAIGNAKWYRHSGNEVGSSYKVKHILMTQQSYFQSFMLQKLKLICTQNLYKNIYSNIIHIFQK